MREGVCIQLNIAIENELGLLREASSRSVRVEGERTAVSLVYVSKKKDRVTVWSTGVITHLITRHLVDTPF